MYFLNFFLTFPIRVRRHSSRQEWDGAAKDVACRAKRATGYRNDRAEKPITTSSFCHHCYQLINIIKTTVGRETIECIDLTMICFSRPPPRFRVVVIVQKFHPAFIYSDHEFRLIGTLKEIEHFPLFSLAFPHAWKNYLKIKRKR